MDETSVFAAALGLLGTPWQVQQIDLDATNKKLTIHLGFARGTRFAHPQSGELLPVHDTLERKWRHMNFFQFACEIVAPLPRVGHGGPEGPSIQAVHVPWARPGSGFSMLLEAMMVVLCKSGMTVQEAARVRHNVIYCGWSGTAYARPTRRIRRGHNRASGCGAVAKRHLSRQEIGSRDH